LGSRPVRGPTSSLRPAAPSPLPGGGSAGRQFLSGVSVSASARLDARQKNQQTIARSVSGTTIESAMTTAIAVSPLLPRKSTRHIAGGDDPVRTPGEQAGENGRVTATPPPRARLAQLRLCAQP